MRRCRVGMLLVLSALLLTGTMAVAAASGAFEGIITDADGIPLPGATVAVRSASQGVERAVTTDASGRYRIEDLPPASDYALTAGFSGGGYATLVQDRLVVHSGQTSVESLRLFVEHTEQVVVSAKRAAGRVVELEKVGQSTTFSAEFLEGLPLLGRNYQDILTLAAGVVDPDGDGNVNIYGGRAENFQALIDGVSNQDPLGGTFLSNLNTDAIAEVEVIQTGADASFRRGSGGFANIITKSGSNDFEGTFTLSFRSSIFDGNGQTGGPESNFRSLRPALSLSGALKRDRLWYLVTGEHIRDDVPVNTLSGRGALIRENNGSRYLAKLTWALGTASKLTTQIRADPYELTNRGVNSNTLEEAGFSIDQGGPFYQVQMDTVFSPTVFLKSLAAFSDTAFGITPNSPQEPGDNRPFLSKAYDINLDTNSVTGSYFLNHRDQRQRWTWTEDLSIFVDDAFGRHDIGVGMSYERERYAAEQYRGMVRTFRLLNEAFGSENPAEVSGGRRFLADETLGIPEREGGFNHLEGFGSNYGAYITDTWLPRGNLSITAGVRIDREEVHADGYSPFDVHSEFNDFQAFMNACTQAPPGTQHQAAMDLLARRDPALLAAFLGSGGSFSPTNGCVQARPFFLTFPKQKFTNDCRRPSSLSYCTSTLNNFSLVLFHKGNRAADKIRIKNTNLAPRFTISWDPWSSSKTKLYATWGRYFDKTNLAVITAEQGPDVRSRTFVFNTITGGSADSGQQASDPTVNLVSRDLRTEFKDEWTIGFEREIAPETKIGIRYVSNRYRNQLQDVDVNHYVRDVGPEFQAAVRRQVGTLNQVVGFIPLGGPALCEFDFNLGEGLVPTRQNGLPRNVVVVGDQLAQPNGTADDCFGQFAVRNGVAIPVADGVPDLFRRNILFNNILFISNQNYSDFEAVSLEFTRRLKRNWQFTASWTHGRSIGAADQFLDESGNDPSLVSDEFGFTGIDIRNVVTVSVTTILPWGDLQLGSIMRYFSGYPFSIRDLATSYDAANQATLRTTFPTGARNDQRSESHMLFDVTLEKGFLLGRANATAQVLVHNLLAEDFLTADNLVNDILVSQRDFGRRFEARFKVNF